MRVLHVIPSVSHRDGGPSQAVFGMTNALQGLGVEVQIATTNADGCVRLDIPLNRVILSRDVPTIFFQRQWGTSFKFSATLARWLHCHVADFDAVHIHAVFNHSSLAAGA